MTQELTTRAERAAKRVASRSKGGAVAAGGAAVAIAGRELIRRADSDDQAPRGYRLKRKEPAADGVKRVARGRIEHALEALGGEDPVDAIHEARKDLKKLRSLVRLVRDELGDAVYRFENAHYRDIGRSLAGWRDADAMREALTGLRERHELDPKRFEEIEESVVGGERSAAGGDQESARESATDAIVVAADRIERWPIAGEEWDLFEPGLRRSYRRGRNRFRDAAEALDDEGLHEWRKRVKDLWYHVRVLREADRKRLGELGDELHELSDHLGDDHDLAMLRERAIERTPDGEERDELIDLLDRRRGELQLEALSLGERLYDEKPKAFTRSIL